MPSSSSPSLRSHRSNRCDLVLVAALALGTSACEGLDGLLNVDNDTLVHVFTTHHATPEEGTFPERGGDRQARVFENDLGWTITLDNGYVVTTGVNIASCEGSTKALNMYWGPLAENLAWSDLDLESIGGVKLRAGEYCTVEVIYDVYHRPDSAERHEVPEVDDVEGSTVYLSGFAQRGEEIIRFKRRVEDRVLVEIDISDFNDGRPFRVRKDEGYPEELTLSKTYDRFFDGVDFSTKGLVSTIDSQSLEVLEVETRLSVGTTVTPL